MIKQRHVKQGFGIGLVTSFVIMYWNYFLNPINLENLASSSVEYSEYLARNESIANQNINVSDSKSYISSIDKISDELSHLEVVRISKPEKTPSFSKCSYDKQNCPKAKKNSINIHLIPHSHDDPGFKKTMDEYFNGLENEIQNISNSKVLDNVIQQLTLNEEFSYAEVVFFSKWWHLQNESNRETVRTLVQNGRFEFVNGGWCVNDEATTNYADIIDQMSLGLGFLAETFGECGRPKVAFQADTFGHSREQVFLSSLMGFDGLLVGRVDKEDKKHRIDSLEMEMIWSSSDLPGKHPSIFTGITYNVFDPPQGFCFDINCHGGVSEPINDDVDSEKCNVKEKAELFLNYCLKQAEAYKTNNIAVFMGTDFTYENAEIWFVNMDKLIKHINNRQNENRTYIFYSTPACYLKALNEADKTWPTKKDDFFPYHGDFPFYWAGYFSSRPSLKYMARQGSSLLQACKQMASVLKLKNAKDEGDLSVMKEAMALLQHHDAITGTSSQRVTDDYVRILFKGVEECRKTTTSYYQAELPRNDKVKEFKLVVNYCNLLNMSECEVTTQKGKSFAVNIYNPLAQYINKYIRIPVTQEYNETFFNFQVIDSNGKILPSQIMPIPSFVKSIPGRNSSANHELIFLTTQVPPLGSKSYYIEVSVSRNTSDPPILIPVWNSLNPSYQTSSDLKISNEKLSLNICKDTGLITSVTFLGKTKIPLEQQFYWYNGNGGHCTFTPESASGVYVFNPLKDSALHLSMGTQHFSVYKGDLVEEIQQKVNEYVGQIIRLYKDKDYIEFDWIIGPVPIEDGIGKEIITRYRTDFKNNGTFYTDANGRQNVLRTRDQGLANNANKDPISSNYYPITSHIHMTDLKSGYRMSVLLDRAQGGGSIEDGQLEFLIHRRLVQQDYCAFNEPLNEIAHGEGLVVRGTHRLFFEDTKDKKKFSPGSSTLRSLVLERNREPEISFVDTNYSSDQWKQFYESKLQFLHQPLPENVKLVTFEPRPGYEGQYIFRLEHIYEVGEHPVLSSPVKVAIKGLFKGFNIESIDETTLDGNAIKSELTKLKWKSTEKDVDANFEYHTSLVSLDYIELMPMEIRTFIIKLLVDK